MFICFLVVEAEINKKYCNVTRTAIQIYLSLCEQCQGKKKIRKKGLVVAPILSDHMNSRCQVDLIDMQSEPDRDYRFILNYQDHLTKFTILKPLKSKTAEEVAYVVVDIFCMFGAPFILQSDNGREFFNRIIEELKDLWPGLKLVHGKPRHSQSQGSVERSNQDVRDMLVAWMLDNNTKQWSDGLRFIQSKKNRALHEGIKKSPYEAMFGSKQRIGLADSSLESEVYDSLKTEEDLEKMLEGMTCETEQQNEEIVTNAEPNPVATNAEPNPVACYTCEEFGITQPCTICGLKVHIKCGLENEGEVTCSLCFRSDTIKVQREDAKAGLEKQAEKMLTLSREKLPPAEIGQNVVVKVPDVDRGRLAPRSVLAVVLNVNESSLYKLGTKDGALERLYSRNEFIFADSNFINLSDVPSCSINLRKASALSSGSRQGFVKCNCKRYCNTKRCNCKANKVLCNSKCHDNSACKNK